MPTMSQRVVGVFDIELSIILRYVATHAECIIWYIAL
ncbi:hypothetical protein APH_0169 [Anaplasma phagocytophilum str. HZ]|uniref:Uncharacterized protein n=1 Tax=Anaplasma phagocytophilum (strain HZ) TaxID=212042 RepID=Q2GLF8_ANAPZ|nr:hypothetical protein APH_0169 [Anaplasma phagocytophilum str. HZ]